MTKRFSTKTVAQLALLSALATVLLMLEFPILPAATYLQLNFSDFPALIAAFAYGPIGGMIVTVVKILSEFFISGSKTGGVGMLANLIVGAGFVLPAGFIYQKRKTLKRAIIALAVSSVTMIAAACFANYFILIPFMMDVSDAKKLDLILTAMLPFNAIKAAVTSIITFFVYKPMGKFLNLFDKVFDNTDRHGVNVSKPYISKSPMQTEEFAKALAQKCKGGEIFMLEGEMGTGKTVFAKGFAKGLGVEETVTSPTFAIHNTYHGRLTLHHFDFYRIDSTAAETLGLSEMFGQDGSVCLIEWGANIAELLPQGCKKIKITAADDESRTLEVV